jgi:predicted nucleic acid-binding protein
MDSSVVVKRYLTEVDSVQVRLFLKDAEALGTAAISRAEVVAAFGKALRLGGISSETAESARRILLIDWRDFASVEISEPVIDRACALAWGYGLRGYDSVQLSAAITWQEALGVPVTFATFDRRLWEAAARVGLALYPPDPPGIR